MVKYKVQAAIYRAESGVADFAVVVASILCDDGFSPYEAFDSGKIDAMLGEVFLTLCFIPFVSII
jgi:hypothetical protein